MARVKSQVTTTHKSSSEGYGYLVADVMRTLLHTPWYAVAITATIGFILLTRIVPYSQVLPGGAVVSPFSWLWLLCSAVFAVVCGLLAPILSRHVPFPLAMAACACAPTVLELSLLAKGVAAFWIVLAVGAASAVCLRAVWLRRVRWGWISSVCVSLVTAAVCMMALRPIAESMAAHQPEFFSTGYACKGEDNGHGVQADLARRLLVSVTEAHGVRDCACVVVSPFCMDVDGRIMFWSTNSDGDDVLLVASEYAANCTEDKLVDLARRMANKDRSEAFLFSGWLDG